MYLGINALTNLLISMLSILLCWRIVGFVHIEQLLRLTNPVHARAVRILLSIVLGHSLASFIIEYVQWSSMLSHLVQ